MQCANCDKPAVFFVRNAAKYRGVKKRRRVVANKEHDLCPACWRNYMQSKRAKETQ